MDYKHTIVVDRQAWFIRFYCWLWDASSRDVNLCKLFWSFFPLFLFPVLLIRLIVIEPLKPFLRLILFRLEERERLQAMIQGQPLPTRQRRRRRFRLRKWLRNLLPSRKREGPSVLSRLLGQIANVMARIVFEISRFLSFVKRIITAPFRFARWLLSWAPWLSQVVSYLLFALMAVAGLALFALIVYEISLNWEIAVTVFAVCAVVLGSVMLGVLAMAFNVDKLVVDHGVKPVFGRGGSGGKVFKGIATPFVLIGYGFYRGFKGIGSFGKLMWLGAKAVKSQTCPQIQVRERS